LQLFLVLPSTLVKADQIYEGNSEAKHAQTDPKKGVRYYADYDEIDQPEGGSNQVGDPEELVVNVIDFDVGVC
jgi:hypothetical protein